jgi:hypothetical protein
VANYVGCMPMVMAPSQETGHILGEKTFCLELS